MKYKKLVISAVVVIVIIVLLISRGGTSSSPESVKIGNILFMTGPLASLGEQELNGMKLAETQINKTGGINGRKLELVTEDYAGDSKQAVSAFEKLKNEGVRFILIDGGAAIGPVGPLVRSNSDVMSMVPIGITHSYFDDNPRTCRLAFTARDYGATIGMYLKNTFNRPRIAFLVSANEYGKAAMTQVSMAVTEMGGSIILGETYEQGVSDFRTQITKLKEKQSDIDALVVINATNSIEPMLMQLKQLGFSKPIVSDMFSIVNASLKDRSLAEGVVFIDYPFVADPHDSDSVELASFKREYFAAYGKYPVAAAVVGYDAVMTLAVAMKHSAGLTAQEVSTYLTTRLGEYKGVSGTFSFDSDCEVKRETVMRKVVDGEFVTVR